MYRCEHPKPQFYRENWVNLNGKWQFEIDDENNGVERGLCNADAPLSTEIEVPFCPESSLSGIKHTDFMKSVWYKREFDITEDKFNGRIRLHFGAVDYKATVYVNGKQCFTHVGGYVPFVVDITEFAVVGTNTVTLHAEDDTTNRMIPSGKQCERPESYGCLYTRTTGIWQTVWLEFVPKNYIVKTKYDTDAESATLNITATLCGKGKLTAVAYYEGREVGRGETESAGTVAYLSIKLSEKHLWEVGNGRLYDLVLTYGDDVVKSYFGLRTITLDGYRFLINGKSVFQRLVLDQGFYPDGIYTAPSDGELVADIERSLAMGFNGARLHEKVFEERFLYHCDRLGYIVWGEFPNWGLNHTYVESIYGILPEWLSEIERDYNHPAIIGWCPFNETWDLDGRWQIDDLISCVYKATKAADSSRPCIDTSGAHHVITDIYDVHNYEQDVEKFADYYKNLPVDGTFVDQYAHRQHYTVGQPMFVSEYGGIAWSADKSGWGYGNAPQTEEEFISRLRGLSDTLLDNPCMLGFCYTQLTDIEQEQNGLYTYDRRPKFDPAIIHPILSKKAAIED